MVDAELGGGSSSCSARRHLEEGKEMRKTETALGDDKVELERRRGTMADAWKLASPAATAAVWAAYEHSVEQEKHSGAQ